MPAPKGPNAPQVHEATLWVHRTFKTAGETTSEEQDQGPIEVRAFRTIPARVSARLGRTINLGNYESIRLEVGVEYPCYAEEVEDGTALSAVTGIVGDFLANEIEALKEALAKGVL